MLTKLCINNNNITEEATDDIAAAISNNTNLQEFDIGRNTLETVGVIKISRSLQKISKLTNLYIDNNNICDGQQMKLQLQLPIISIYSTLTLQKIIFSHLVL